MCASRIKTLQTDNIQHSRLITQLLENCSSSLQMGCAVYTEGCRCVVPCVIVAGIICFTMNVRPHYFGIKTLRVRYNLHSNKKEMETEIRFLPLDTLQ